MLHGSRKGILGHRSGDARRSHPHRRQWPGQLVFDTMTAMSSTLTIPLKASVGTQTWHFSTAGEKFEALADAWLKHQAGRSTLDLMHPAHQQIVGMGAAAIPHLLCEVKQRSGNWFAALRAIARESPVPPESRGDFEAATAAWLEWGRRNGYRSADGQTWTVARPGSSGRVSSAG
jgi:hypothetical protein